MNSDILLYKNIIILLNVSKIVIVLYNRITTYALHKKKVIFFTNILQI